MEPLLSHQWPATLSVKNLTLNPSMDLSGAWTNTCSVSYSHMLWASCELNINGSLHLMHFLREQYFTPGQKYDFDSNHAIRLILFTIETTALNCWKGMSMKMTQWQVIINWGTEKGHNTSRGQIQIVLTSLMGRCAILHVELWKRGFAKCYS